MKLFKNTKFVAKSLVLVAAMSLLLSACGGNTGSDGNSSSNQETGSGQSEKISGSVDVDGSSTVYPITEAVAEEFQAANSGAKVTVGTSGTGGGFKRFVKGETDISNASREIKAEEEEQAKANNIEYTKLEVAYDGLSVVVNKDNDFVQDLTVDELKKIWEPNSTVKTWKDVRADWPAEEIKLYGPGTDSGTFDYFTEAVIGKSGEIRTDFTASEDDNVLVQGVSSDKNALGYFGYAYYLENQDKLKVVKINGVEPSEATIKDGSYTPLSRPLFIYVNNKSLKEDAAVKEFVTTYMEIAKDLVGEVGYVALEDSKYEEQLKTIEGIK